MRSHAYNPMRILDAFFVFMFILLLFFFSSCTSARAEGWQFGLDGGLAIPTQNAFPTNSGDAGTNSVPYFNALEQSEGWIISVYATHTLVKPWIHLGVLGSFDTTGTSANSPIDPSQGGMPGAKQNLGMVETWAVMPYLRLDPWTFGNWTPFLGLGLGWGWNQWNTQGDIPGPFSSSISQTFVTRLELGTDYRMSNHFQLEGMIGGQINDPLANVALPNGQGGMDQNFNMILFFAEIGFRFGL